MYKAYIGLDQSLTNTGVSYTTEEDDYKTIKYFTIKTTTDFIKVERYVQIINGLKHLFDKYKVAAIFLEEAYCSKMSSSVELVKLESVLQFYLHINNYRYYSLSPRPRVVNSWTKLVNSEGTKDKFLELIVKYLVDPINEHEGDSIGILIAGLRFKNISHKSLSNYIYKTDNILNVKSRKTRGSEKSKSDRFVAVSMSTRNKGTKTN